MSLTSTWGTPTAAMAPLLLVNENDQVSPLAFPGNAQGFHTCVKFLNTLAQQPITQTPQPLHAKGPKRQITPLWPFALESPLLTSQFQNRQFAHEIPSNSLSFAKCVGSRRKPAQGAIPTEVDQATLLGGTRPFTKTSLNLRTSRPFCSMHHAPRPNGARTSALTSALRSLYEANSAHHFAKHLQSIRNNLQLKGLTSTPWTAAAFELRHFSPGITSNSPPSAASKPPTPTRATALRTCVVLVFAWIMAALAGPLFRHRQASAGNRGLFLALSGLATGASWLCSYYAIAAGQVSELWCKLTSCPS